jgi:hypothetical protein
LGKFSLICTMYFVSRGAAEASDTATFDFDDPPAMAHRVSNPDWASNLAVRTMEGLAANYGYNSGSGNRLNMAMGACEEDLGWAR